MRYVNYSVFKQIHPKKLPTFKFQSTNQDYKIYLKELSQYSYVDALSYQDYLSDNNFSDISKFF